MKKFPTSTWLLFLLPSITGIILFMIPLKFNDEWKVPIAKMADWFSGIVAPVIPIVAMVIITLAAIGSILFSFVRVNDKQPSFLVTLFKVPPFWLIVRILGAIFTIMVNFKIGPEAVWSENTGGLLLASDGLVSFLFTVFLFAGLLLPLLLNFGLLEFFGSLMVKIMRPLFQLPGRSSIDALASWIGDGTIGVLLTSKQYEEGHYTQKEAAIIATNFSVVSITFSLVIIGRVGLDSYFIPFYATVILTGLILALVMPRLYPLRQKQAVYIDGRAASPADEQIPANYTVFKYGLENALENAEKNRSLSKTVTAGFRNVLDMWFGVIPVVMAFGVIALMLAEFTPVFQILGKPFEFILSLLAIPEATAAAPTMVVGFADMLLPVILAEGITSPITLFTIAVISVVQLIYMSEVGGLILGTKIPLNIWELIVIFVLRTIIALPIVAGIAHLLF